MHWQTTRFRIDLTQPRVMGIVNVTPDSFSDGGLHLCASAAMRHCDQLVAEGGNAGAGAGDRHRLLFSAAANLGESGCPVELAHELLREAALDSGLSPSETKRQIDCGLKHSQKGNPS